MSESAPSDVARRGRRRRRRVDALPIRADIAGMAMLAAAVVGSALWFGAQQPGALVTVALLSAGAAVVLRPASTPRLLWLPFGLACYTLLQIVPLPFAWVAALSPAAGGVWQGALAPFGEPPPAWVTVSVDPAGTLLETLKWFGYTCVFVAAAGVRARRGPVLLVLLLTVSALAVCLVTLVHGILDIQRIYGVFKPTDASQWLRGPFVNGNNLAGYLNLGLFSCVGLWLSPDKKVPSWPLALAVPLLTVEVLLAGSRGGIACLLLGTLLMGVVVLRRRRLIPRRVLNWIALAPFLALVIAVSLGGTRVLDVFADRDMHAKVSAWRWTLDLIRDFPVFGVGRGAFEPAFEPYRKLMGFDWTMVFPYAENFPLQWVADWGIVVGLGGLAAFAFVLWPSMRRAFADPLTCGVAVGISLVLLQNLVDLALEIFAVFALVVVAFASIIEPVRSETKPRFPVLLLAPAGVALSAALVVGFGASPVRFERQRVSFEYAAWVRDGARDPATFLRALRGSMLRHPSEAYFPLVGSVVAIKAKADPMRWIGRALERSPFDAQVHLRLAELLTARGARKQALFHLRLAATYDVLLREAALTRAAGLARSIGDLPSAFPLGLPGAELLPEVCRRAGGPIRIGCWREMISRQPADASLKRELATALLDSVEAGGTPCDSPRAEACLTDVRRLLGELGGAKDDWRVGELLARELVLQGKPREAVALMLERCPAIAEALGCCQRAVEVAGRSKDLALLARAGERYAALVCSEPRHCATAHERIAQSYAAMGAYATALKHFALAAEHEPSVDRWLQNAEVAARAGLARSAEIALERARREPQLDAERRRRIDAIEETLRSPPPAATP